MSSGAQLGASWPSRQARIRCCAGTDTRKRRCAAARRPGVRRAAPARTRWNASRRSTRSWDRARSRCARRTRHFAYLRAGRTARRSAGRGASRRPHERIGLERRTLWKPAGKRDRDARHRRDSEHASRRTPSGPRSRRWRSGSSMKWYVSIAAMNAKSTATTRRIRPGDPGRDRRCAGNSAAASATGTADN